MFTLEGLKQGKFYIIIKFLLIILFLKLIIFRMFSFRAFAQYAKAANISVISIDINLDGEGSFPVFNYFKKIYFIN